MRCKGVVRCLSCCLHLCHIDRMCVDIVGGLACCGFLVCYCFRFACRSIRLLSLRGVRVSLLGRRWDVSLGCSTQSRCTCQHLRHAVVAVVARIARAVVPLVSRYTPIGNCVLLLQRRRLRCRGQSLVLAACRHFLHLGGNSLASCRRLALLCRLFCSLRWRLIGRRCGLLERPSLMSSLCRCLWLLALWWRRPPLGRRRGVGRLLRSPRRILASKVLDRRLDLRLHGRASRRWRRL
mmetsp:Transcript_13399/g.42057  ORF Transcript_13399/g.42057 Transcript_13399/m.42057 type:complete len:237 (+) Transcript_13399:974-1684(+)